MNERITSQPTDLAQIAAARLDELERIRKTLGLDGASPSFPRLCYAAAHVVMKDSYGRVRHSVDRPGRPGEFAEHVDWDRTMDYRRYLDDLGFAIAEAMDTAQRFALGWSNAERLIQECGRLGLRNGFVAGAGYDHLDPGAGFDAIVEGVVRQARTVEQCGGETILLPIPALTAANADENCYVEIYKRIVEQLDGPVFIHWLGHAFMPALKGYFPGDSFFRVMALDPDKIKGAKLSLLDAEFERTARKRLLEANQFVLTGDDFHFGHLIRGGNQEPSGKTRVGVRPVPLGDFSHALLGIFDGIAGPASLALHALGRGAAETYDELMGPCEELGRWIFQAPTQYYKSGLAFLAWLNGRQPNPMLLNHEEKNRSIEYYVQTAQLAARAGAIDDPAMAEQRLNRMEAYLH